MRHEKLESAFLAPAWVVFPVLGYALASWLYPSARFAAMAAGLVLSHSLGICAARAAGATDQGGPDAG